MTPDPASPLQPQGDSEPSPRQEAVEAVARALHWNQYGTGFPLSGEAFDRSREKADLAVSTMQALGWHRG